MKKITLLLIAIMTIFVLAACGSQEEAISSNSSSKTDIENKADENETPTDDEVTEKEESVEVDKNLLSVEVTVPASLFETTEQDIDQVVADAKKEEGIKDATKNSDGSITYKMSKSKHKEMMEEMGKQVVDTVNEMKSSGDYVSIKDVTYNKSFSEFTMIVNKSDFENSFDAFAALGLGMGGMFYQVFDGTKVDDLKVTILLEDADTGEVFDEVIYPDDLEE